jgi:NitT/TauT family transport system substrate-binding protein
VTLKNMGQAEIISAMSSQNAELGGLWAPNIYTLEEKAGARVLCSGKDAGATVPSALIVRGEYAEQNPENVAKFLAIYLRGWAWANANKTAAIAMMKQFYEQGGVSISETSMRKEFDTRPTFDLEQQLAYMNRAGAASRVDGWFNDIASFMRGSGALQTVPAPVDFVTDAFMKRVAADPKLREFAGRTN